MTAPDPRWEAFAAREPYFAVLTAEKYLRANLTLERLLEFFDSGEAQVDWTLRMIEPLMPQFAPMSTLEYGCGVGRLAVWFARRPGTVTAVDSSPAMLEAARQETEQRALSITFYSPSEFFAQPRAFDLVNCCLVFQRLPREEGLALLRDLVGCIGDGGIGVFQFPYRQKVSRVVETSRWLRDRVPAVNGLVNVLRGKPFRDPFVPSHTYDLYDVFRVIEESSVDATHVVVEPRGQLPSATVIVRMPSTRKRRRPASDPQVSDEPDVPDPGLVIDVQELIARSSIEDHNRKAEEYYATLKSWDHHLAKPFNQPDEAPALLIDFATLLQGLHLRHGMTVLEFGAGTGWLSRFLTQLGCRVILLDVAPSALRISGEMYQKQPIIGDQPQPQFLLFDGHRIDLPDVSVERIVCFHAFHHAAKPVELLREFSRILRPGGIAAFAEPGPHHSKSAASQFEMRTYGVVENDIDVHAIWRAARIWGFADIKLIVFNELPYHIPLKEYEDFLAGGDACDEWVVLTRAFLRNVRSFLLFKGGPDRIDSRSVTGLACRIHAALVTQAPVEGECALVDVAVVNSGTAIWVAWDAHGGVAIGAHLYDGAGALLNFDLHCEPLTRPSREIGPRETIHCRFPVPALAAGRYVLEFDCVASGVTWFAQVGSQPVRVPIEVHERSSSTA